MEGKEAIVARIRSDAEQRAQTIREEAEEKARARIADAQKRAEEYLKEGRKRLAAETEAVVSRRKTVAELDCRKELLRSKREILDEVFARALAKMSGFGKDKYTEILRLLLEENAEEGDTVVVSERAPVGRAEIEAMPVFKDRGLRYGGEDDFVGGIKLLGEVCDKNLSFEALLAARRAEFETEIVPILFPEKQ